MTMINGVTQRRKRKYEVLFDLSGRSLFWLPARERDRGGDRIIVSRSLGVVVLQTTVKYEQKGPARIIQKS